jgi:ribosomal-protein-alanine N-acetyltransferase
MISQSSEPPISTSRLLLEPIEVSHAAKLFESLTSPLLYQFIPQDPPPSVKNLEKRYSRWEQRQSPDGEEIWLNYALLHTELDKYVGTLQATVHNYGTATIAYEVFPDYWKQGIAKEACVALIDHLFQQYCVRTIQAYVDTRNQASWSLLESLGFERGAVIEAADHFKGSNSDEFVYLLHNLAEVICGKSVPS